jgi:hypothetical protein
MARLGTPSSASDDYSLRTERDRANVILLSDSEGRNVATIGRGGARERSALF